MAVKLPDYLAHSAEIVFKQPYELKGTKLFGFLYKAEKTNLQNLCDMWLNKALTAKNKRYMPIVPYVMISYSHTDHVQSTDAEGRIHGWIPETETVVWVPVALVRTELGIPIIEKITWMVPYIFVDNAISMAAGREVYGFPKTIGSFQLPADPANGDPLVLNSFAAKTFSPTSEITWQELMRIHRTNPFSKTSVKDAPETVIKDAKEAYNLLKENIFGKSEFLIPGLQLVAQMIYDLLTASMPITFLKQFRDVKDGSKACYRSLTEANAQVTAFDKLRILWGDYQLDLNNTASFPFSTDLGVSSGAKASMAFEVDFDFSILAGKEV